MNPRKGFAEANGYILTDEQGMENIMLVDMDFEKALNVRDAALAAYDEIQREADADAEQARKDAEWRNRYYNDPDMLEDEHKAWSDAYDATWKRLGGPAVDDELTSANMTLEPFFARQRENVQPDASHPLRKLRNANVILDDE